MEAENDTCIRCREAPRVEESYCGNCYWRVRAEVEAGFYALRVYLRRWSAFRDWEAAHS